jgi:hypothetical protein
VDADAHREAPLVPALDLLVERRERPLDRETREHGAPRCALEGQGRAEERHDAVAGELVHRALIAVHLVEDAPEALIHERVHRLRVGALGQRGVVCDISEQDRDVAAFALERRLLGQDAVDEVPGRVRARIRARVGYRMPGLGV